MGYRISEALKIARNCNIAARKAIVPVKYREARAKEGSSLSPIGARSGLSKRVKDFVLLK